MQTAAMVLREAASLGEVCVVTTAARGWVEVCCKVAAPELLGLMQDLRIEIIYAKEAMLACHVSQMDEEGLSFAQVCKERAMRRALRRRSRQASRHAQVGGTWSSVLSIGDSNAERRALQEVLFRHDSIDFAAFFQECHCKTVKFMKEPRIDILLVQLRILASWLKKVVGQDSDLDIDFGHLANEC